MQQEDVKRPLVRDQRPAADGADGMEVIFYTDPLCCWSWAMEPAWRRLQEEWTTPVKVVYKMAGLLPSWRNFHDTVNSIRKPIHMGPEWMHAARVSGVGINTEVWIKDPPASSFPACVAVKCAGLQSAGLEAVYLYMLREAIMVRNKNIARTNVLLEVAGMLACANADFDLFQFRQDLLGQAGRDAFRKDWQETKYLGIHRLPTLVFRSNGRHQLLSGYQSLESLRKAYSAAAEKHR